MVVEHLVRARADGQAGPHQLSRALRSAHRPAEPHAVPRAPDRRRSRRARRARRAVALALIDLERFKAINDTLGQQVGDRVLQELGAAPAGGRRRHPPRRAPRRQPVRVMRLLQDAADAEEVARRIEADSRRCSARRSRSTAARCASRPRPASPCSRTTARTPTRCSATPRRRSSARRRPASAILFYAPADQRARLRAGRPREPPAPGGRAGRAVPALPAEGRPRHAQDRRARGADALARARRRAGRRRRDFVPVLEQTGLILEAGRRRSPTAARRLPRLEGARPERAAHRGQRLGAAAAPQELRRRRARRARRRRRPTAAASTWRSPRAC